MTDTVTLPPLHATLASGAQIPLLGFGTWQLEGAGAVQATRTALELGYRHLDTATVYGNEQEVGTALRESGVPRGDVFVTTKIPPDAAGEAQATLQSSLRLLGTGSVDLWLIHWTDGSAHVDLWRELVRAQSDGLVHDIGVSNYSLAQIDEVTEATGVRPAVNQISWSPFRYDAELLEGHRQRGIVVEGYSGLKRGTMDHPVVQEVAARVGRTPAQVLIRWQLQHGVVVIPKSTNPERIRQNADVADLVLSHDDMAALDGLAGTGKRG